MYRLFSRRQLFALAGLAVMIAFTVGAWPSRLAAETDYAGGFDTGRAEALALDQVRHREFVHEFDSAPGVDRPFAVPTTAFRYLHGGPQVDSPPRPLGADTDSILSELGLDAGKIAEFRRDGVV